MNNVCQALKIVNTKACFRNLSPPITFKHVAVGGAALQTRKTTSLVSACFSAEDKKNITTLFCEAATGTDRSLCCRPIYTVDVLYLY